MLDKAPRPHTLSAQVVDKLREVSTATVTSQLLKRGYRNAFIPSLQVLRPDLRMVGYAFTLRYVPAREDIGIDIDYDNSRNVQRLAIEAIQPDDVLVIDARGDVSAASMGHILATRMAVRGAAGLVSDGALRDTPSFRELDLPTYVNAAHATTSSVAHHPVDMNIPVGCGGVLVIPGDIVVGDAEGAVIIPSQIAESVANDAYEQDRMERFILTKVASGESIKGVYPPDKQTIAEYTEWSQKQGNT